MKEKSLSRVQLLATPRTAPYQAPAPMGFSRQEYWGGLPLLSIKISICSSHHNKNVTGCLTLFCCSVVQFSSVAQSCPTLSDPIYCSPPVSSVHGIFQAKVLEWGAIAFSESFALSTSYPLAFEKPGPSSLTSLFRSFCDS